MKQVFSFSAVIFLAALLPLNAIATSFGTNITISDKNSTLSAGWYGEQEDNEVEPGMEAGQKWDLEGFFLDDKTLTMVGGFDFKNGNPGYNSFTSGDIFIDIDGNAEYGKIAGSGNSENLTMQKSYGYDYVLDLDFATSTYGVFQITDDTWVKTAYYNQNEGSSPWLYMSGGTWIKNGLFEYRAGVPDEKGSFVGGTHYTVTVSLDFLTEGTDFISHFTMGCGNDNLMGEGKILPNPEPATLLLMGCGLIGLAGIGRKKLSKGYN
jgi:hypothetical protein